MIMILFSVNDESIRSTFLQRETFEALRQLSIDDKPKWGRFSPSQMVEHLVWAAEISNGSVVVQCNVHPKLLERFKPFLFNDTPTSHEFMNPLLKKGLPPNRYQNISEAAAALQLEMDRFFRKQETERQILHTHPVFGPLNHEEWERSHYKHFYHHLLQFGLIQQA